jgi:hypothetical protein
MIASPQLQFPCLYFLLLREGVRLQNALDHLTYSTSSINPFHATLKALHFGLRIVSIGIGLGLDFELADFRGGFTIVALFALAGARDVDGEWMLKLLGMEAAMYSFSCAATVEAVQTYI